MDRSKEDLRAFYKRQAAKLLELARNTTDRNTTEQLLKMANDYITVLEADLTPEPLPQQPSPDLERPGAFDSTSIAESGREPGWEPVGDLVVAGPMLSDETISVALHDVEPLECIDTQDHEAAAGTGRH
jgi:hypothetical protein